MGIYQLNLYLKNNCKKSIEVINLHKLKDKVIVIDASIYMYKYAGEQRLVEGMYQLISTLLYYNITPLFVFDGASPTEKKELVADRHIKKRAAKKEYYTVLESIKDNKITPTIYHTILNLKKTFVRLKKEDYNTICTMIDLFGLNYITAEKEADELCAKLVIEGKAWACMSEDTDMFVYGCPRVLRYVNLIQQTVAMYDMKSILRELNMTQEEFTKICVISGTDYNFTSSKNCSLQKTVQYYKKYKSQNLETDFYKWLLYNTNYIVNYNILISTYKMFDVSNVLYSIEILKNNKKISKGKLKEFLEKYNFIFM